MYRFQVSRPTYLLTITAMSVDENKQEHWNEVGLAEPIWLKSHTYYECGLNEDGVPYVREVE